VNIVCRNVMPLNYIQEELSVSIFRARDRICILSQITLFHIATRHFFKIYFVIIHLTVGLSIDLCNADRQDCRMDFSSLTIITHSTQIINTGLLEMMRFVV
jgi:hypothetical protein